VEALLEQVSLGAEVPTRVVGLVAPGPAGPDRIALARIERERGAAAARYLNDRDVAVLEGTMARLDREESAASRTRDAGGVPADVAVRYLADLAGTWAASKGGRGRKLLAEALFERIDALGLRELTVRLTDTAIAHGFGAVIPSRLELGILGNGRGERSRANTFHVYVSAVGDVPQPLPLAHSA
jgi:hypothetical protein